MERWVALGLAGLFGMAYAGLRRWIRGRSQDPGLAPVLVAGGVTGIAACFLLVTDAETVVWLLGLFVVGGLPMIGEYYDQRWRREQAQRDRIEIDL